MLAGTVLSLGACRQCAGGEPSDACCGFTAGEGFAAFYSAASPAAWLHHEAALHGKPDTIEHEPYSSLTILRDRASSGLLMTLLRLASMQAATIPLSGPSAGKDGSCFVRELALGAAEFAPLLSFALQIRHIRTDRERAFHSVRPARSAIGWTIVSAAGAEDALPKSLRQVQDLPLLPSIVGLA